MNKILLLSLLACCAGCLAPKTAGVSAERGRLVVEDRAFATRIELVEDKTKRIELGNGFLKTQVTLRNRDSRDVTCQYRFTWKDADGMTLTSAETLWTPLPLHGREEAVLDAVCPVPGAVDFRLVVRPM